MHSLSDLTQQGTRPGTPGDTTAIGPGIASPGCAGDYRDYCDSLARQFAVSGDPEKF